MYTFKNKLMNVVKLETIAKISKIFNYFKHF